MQEKESWDMKENTEKIEAAAKKKDEGNAWFKMEKYARASKRYGKVTHQAFCLKERLKPVLHCTDASMICSISGFKLHRV